MRVTPISGHTSSLQNELETGGPHNPWEESGHVVVNGEWVNAERLPNGYFNGTAPAPPVPAGRSYYVLALKLPSGWTAAGPTAELVSPVAGEAGWPYGEYPTEYQGFGCTETTWIGPPFIAGWPSRLKHGNFVKTTPITNECIPKNEETWKPEGLSEWKGSQSYWWRYPSEIPVTFPKPKECPEGATCPTTPPSLPTVGELGKNGDTVFGAEGESPLYPHKALETWIEPLPGETFEPSEVQIEEVAETWHLHKTNTVGLSLRKESEETKLKAAAEDCIEQTKDSLEVTPTEATNKCSEEIVFLPGTDVKTATEHDKEAISGHPAWASLKYESSGEKESEVTREWYKGEASCLPKEAGKQCDEYPFYASEEGGSGASLKKIDAADNELEGSRYGNMVSACKPTRGTPLFVVPTDPSASINTFYVCDK